MTGPNESERWDERWRKAEGPGAHSAFFEKWRPRLVSRLRRVPGARVLDVAAGLGRHSLPLARAGIAADAAELSKVALTRLGEAARREGLPLGPLRVDLSDPAEAARALGMARYDAVLDFFYLERALLPILARSSRPGGLFLIETRLAAGAPGTAANPRGYWLSPGELGRLLWNNWRVIEMEEGAGLARAAALRR